MWDPLNVLGLSLGEGRKVLPRVGAALDLNLLLNLGQLVICQSCLEIAISIKMG